MDPCRPSPACAHFINERPEVGTAADIYYSSRFLQVGLRSNTDYVTYRAYSTYYQHLSTGGMPIQNNREFLRQNRGNRRANGDNSRKGPARVLSTPRGKDLVPDMSLTIRHVTKIIKRVRKGQEKNVKDSHKQPSHRETNRKHKMFNLICNQRDVNMR